MHVCIYFFPWIIPFVTDSTNNKILCHISFLFLFYCIVFIFYCLYGLFMNIGVFDGIGFRGFLHSVARNHISLRLYLTPYYIKGVMMEWYLPIKETKNEKFSWWGMGWVGEKRIFFKVGKFWAHLNTDDEDRLVKLETQKWTEKNNAMNSPWLGIWLNLDNGCTSHLCLEKRGNLWNFEKM